MTTKKYSVSGMTCAACRASVERAVSSLECTESVDVSLMTNSMTVTFDENVLTEEKLFSAVKDAGYSAGEFVRREESVKREERELKSSLKRLAVSAVFALVMMYVTMGHMAGLPLPAFMSPCGSGNAPLIYALVQIVLCIPVIIINRRYFTDGFRAACHFSPNMNTLVCLGASASFIYGVYITVVMINDIPHAADYTEKLYFESVTMILTLITLGRTLEKNARRKTASAVRALMALTPQTAEVIRDGRTETIPSSELKAGERVIVRSGSSVPCDGTVISGAGDADESMITGESVPVHRKAGDMLTCGTVLVSGYAEMTADKVGDDTTVAKITELVENASSGKAPAQKLADKISGYFVPAVCIIAIITFAVWLIAGYSFHEAVGFGISVLVISCPCALGLATPTAIMCGTGRGASMGILIKSADVIDTLAKAGIAVFDKTGTLTEGRMSVAGIKVFEGDKNEFIKSAAALETASEHPIGKAITEFAGGENLPAVSDFRQTFGGGVSGVVDGKTVYGGNAEFISDYAEIDRAVTGECERLSSLGMTPVIFASNGRITGIISVSDTVRATSREAVEELERLGLETVMLTGDCSATAGAVAEKLGIKRVISGVRPDGKSAAVERLMSGEEYGDDKRRYVIMVGDGINDAPALVMADIGMAVAHGTDIAIESADAVLARSDLRDAASAVRLGRAVMKTIKENLAWAFGYNIICIPLAAGVLYPALGIALTPMAASAAMSLSSVCVVTNALRLMKNKI